jgi:hypothetical protein
MGTKKQNLIASVKPDSKRNVTEFKKATEMPASLKNVRKSILKKQN